MNDTERQELIDAVTKQVRAEVEQERELNKQDLTDAVEYATNTRQKDAAILDLGLPLIILGFVLMMLWNHYTK